jgi:hypothetical protein
MLLLASLLLRQVMLISLKSLPWLFSAIAATPIAVDSL